MTPVILALIAGLANPFSHAPSLQRSHFGVQGWRVNVVKDPFLGQTRCSLERGRMRLEHGVMVFHFSKGTDTANAEFRIDGGPPQSAGDVVVEAAGQGYKVQDGDVRHTGGGRVGIPGRLVRNAQAVAIRPNLGASIRSFPLTGLQPALAAAQSRGCQDLPPEPAPAA